MAMFNIYVRFLGCKEWRAFKDDFPFQLGDLQQPNFPGYNMQKPSFLPWLNLLTKPVNFQMF